MTNHDHCSMSEMRKSAYVKNIKRHLISRHSLPDAEVLLVKKARQACQLAMVRMLHAPSVVAKCGVAI